MHGVYVHWFSLSTIDNACAHFLVSQDVCCTGIACFLVAGIVVSLVAGRVASMHLVMDVFALAFLVHSNDLLLPFVVSFGNPNSNIIDSFDIGRGVLLL